MAQELTGVVGLEGNNIPCVRMRKPRGLVRPPGCARTQESSDLPTVGWQARGWRRCLGVSTEAGRHTAEMLAMGSTREAGLRVAPEASARGVDVTGRRLGKEGALRSGTLARSPHAGRGDAS